MKTLNVRTLFAALPRPSKPPRQKQLSLGWRSPPVVDHSGVVKLYSRMDGAVLVAADASFKSRTAVGFGMPRASGFHQRRPDSEGAPALEDFILLGGGSPIYVDGALVGAIGVAGGHYSKDEACVTAALEALEQMG